MPHMYDTIERQHHIKANLIKKTLKSLQNIRFKIKVKESENKHFPGVNCYVLMH